MENVRPVTQIRLGERGEGSANRDHIYLSKKSSNHEYQSYNIFKYFNINIKLELER